jgi:hypothetical protein
MVFTWLVRIGHTDQNDNVRGRSRRELLRALGLVALGGTAAPMTACDLFDRAPKRPPEPDPLAPMIAEALDLAARYEAAVASNAALAGRLGPVAQAHRAHAEELARVTGAALPTGTPTPAPTTPAADGQNVLAALRAAEQQGREAAAKACVDAPVQRAALLGSIAAARATHLEVLR